MTSNNKMLLRYIPIAGEFLRHSNITMAVGRSMQHAIRCFRYNSLILLDLPLQNMSIGCFTVSQNRLSSANTITGIFIMGYCQVLTISLKFSCMTLPFLLLHKLTLVILYATCIENDQNLSMLELQPVFFTLRKTQVVVTELPHPSLTLITGI